MKNNFIGKPNAVIFVIVVTLLASFFAINETALSKNYDDDEHRIFELVNTERHKKRLNDLTWDTNLARMARAYSQKMARENFFDHADLSGKTVVDRAKDARIKNWQKIVNFSDFIAIDLTINRHAKSR